MRFEAVVSLFVGAVLLAGGVVSLYAAIPNARNVIAYDSAPPCASVSQAVAAADCRFSGVANVTFVDYDNSARLVLPGGSGRVFVGRPPIDASVFFQSGQTVPVELWRGVVTQMAGIQTRDNPELTDNWSTMSGLGVLLTLIGVGLLVWGVRKWRRPEEADGQTMAPLAVSDALFHGQ